MSLLGSRNQPGSFKDIENVKQLIAEELSSAKSSKYGTRNADLNKFEQLYNKLAQKCRSGMTAQRDISSLLLVLLKISKIEKDSNVSSGFFRTMLAKCEYEENEEVDMEVDDPHTQKLSQDKASRYQFLKSFRYQTQDISEESMCKDLLYVFQGIDGQYITFSIMEDQFVLAHHISVSDSVRKLVTEMCELGWLYKKVNDYMTHFFDHAICEQVIQSLCFALQAELTEYYRLIAILESQHQNYDESDPSNCMNLRKLYLWIQEPLERMKWLAIIVDSIQGLKGGAIISSINSYVLHGSPNTKVLLSRLLREVSAPILTMIKTWMVEGELDDPFNEFFVGKYDNISDDLIWTEKYALKPAMIPSFLTNDLAKKILLTGKAVNFIKICCNEEDWVLDSSEQVPFNAESFSNEESNYSALKNWVYHAYRVTNKELIDFLFKKYQFLTHCNAIRKYLLLGQGDFIQNLMDSMVEELSKPAGQLYKYTLLAILETAVRSSNAYLTDSEFLDRLDVKLLEASPGDNGWEIFSLDYKVDAPINTILTQNVIQGYLKIFKLLWRLKRVEHALNKTWVQQTSYKNELYSLVEIRTDLHKCNLLRNEMLHFIGNLHSYLQVEVIESEWKKFQENLHSCKDLYDIMEIQKTFLDQTHKRAMLTHDHTNLYQSMIKIFDLIHQFTRTQDVLYSSALENYFTQYFEGSNKPDSMDKDSHMIISPEARQQLDHLGKVYRQNFDQFNIYLGELEVDQKSLSFRLDFNGFYEKMREKEIYEDRPHGFDPLNVDDIDDEDDEEEDEEEEDEEEGDPNPFRRGPGGPPFQGYS